MHYRRFMLYGSTGPLTTKRPRDRLCSVPGCDRKSRAHGYCPMHWERVKRHGEPGAADKRIREFGTGGITSQGYVILSGYIDHPNCYKNGKGTIMEHVLVMTKKIGRPLRKGETVHHVNGIRRDNRPENLELWMTQHPSGQRAADRISDALEVLTKYAPDPSLWPEEYQWLRKVISPPEPPQVNFNRFSPPGKVVRRQASFF